MAKFQIKCPYAGVVLSSGEYLSLGKMDCEYAMGNSKSPCKLCPLPIPVSVSASDMLRTAWIEWVENHPLSPQTLPSLEYCAAWNAHVEARLSYVNTPVAPVKPVLSFEESCALILCGEVPHE